MIKKLGRNDHCWCGSGKKYKACHEAFDDKLRYLEDIGHIVPSHKLIKTPEQIEKIKESARINVACLDAVAAAIHEGMNTAEIDKIVYDVTTDMGGIPAPLNYEGYPYSVCTSVNEQVCHGFPSKDVILKSGDIINVDCSTILHGYFSDSSRMFCIGDVKPGGGRDFHEDPWVGYNTRKGTDMVMAPGMMFTIEPMVNMGKVNVVTDEKNGWEVSTADGLPSAQWEIQVLVTEDGHEVISW